MKRATTAELVSTLVELLEILLTDVAADVEVVACELGLKDEIRERFRRALDRVECALRILDTTRGDAGSDGVRENGVAVESDRAALEAEPNGGYKDNDSSDAKKRAWGAVRLLAREWPKDYPLGAVEWLILERMQRLPA